MGGRTRHQHAASDRAATGILDCFETVNKEIPISDLRWQIAHIENASDATLRRMKALNMGWAVQDRLVYSGQIVSKVLGPDRSEEHTSELQSLTISYAVFCLK